MGIDVLVVDLHLSAVANNTLDHGRDLRGSERFQLRINTEGLLLDMPIDHDAPSAVTRVPLRSEVLIPGTEVRGIRRACGRAFAPNDRVANAQHVIGHYADCLPEAFRADVPFSDMGR